MAANTAEPLFFVEHNTQCSETILLIHGGWSGYLSWLKTAEHLSDYHLLIPNVGIYGQSYSPSAGIRPQATETMMPLLADLVRTHAKNGQAHVVGLSLGAHQALHFGALHPQLVRTVFATGVNRFKPFWASRMGLVPYAMFVLQNMDKFVPKSMLNRMLDGADLDADGDSAAPNSLASCHDIVPLLFSGAFAPVRARTLLVAATFGGGLPTDQVDTAREALREVSEDFGNKQGLAMLNKRLIHPWNVQKPELFAEAVRAWITGRDLPEGAGFEPL